MTISRRDNYALTCAALGAGTTGATFKTGANLSAQIDGRTYFKAATDNIAIVACPAGTGTTGASQPNVLASLAAYQVGVYFVLVDTAGAMFWKMQPKTGATTGAAGAGYQAGSVEWPQEDKGYAVVGAIKVATNASGAFVPGTTLLTAANMTVTYFNAGPDLGVSIPI